MELVNPMSLNSIVQNIIGKPQKSLINQTFIIILVPHVYVLDYIRNHTFSHSTHTRVRKYVSRYDWLLYVGLLTNDETCMNSNVIIFFMWLLVRCFLQMRSQRNRSTNLFMAALFGLKIFCWKIRLICMNFNGSFYS